MEDDAPGAVCSSNERDWHTSLRELPKGLPKLIARESCRSIVASSLEHSKQSTWHYIGVVLVCNDMCSLLWVFSYRTLRRTALWCSPATEKPGLGIGFGGWVGQHGSFNWYTRHSNRSRFQHEQPKTILHSKASTAFGAPCLAPVRAFCRPQQQILWGPVSELRECLPKRHLNV